MLPNTCSTFPSNNQTINNTSHTTIQLHSHRFHVRPRQISGVSAPGFGFAALTPKVVFELFPCWQSARRLSLSLSERETWLLAGEWVLVPSRRGTLVPSRRESLGSMRERERYFNTNTLKLKVTPIPIQSTLNHFQIKGTKMWKWSDSVTSLTHPLSVNQLSIAVGQDAPNVSRS